MSFSQREVFESNKEFGWISDGVGEWQMTTCYQHMLGENSCWNKHFLLLETWEQSNWTQTNLQN